jgi:uncharacterized protein YecT (DUF1311 family)
MKAEYLAKLKLVESQERNNEYQSDFQMIEDFGHNYQIWDAHLNEVYQVLKTQLSETEMSQLKAKQLEWIAFKEAEAQKAYDESGGGTLSRMVQMEVLFNLTKERCYLLVNEYMK